MSYDCPDFYDDVCRAAGEHLGVQFTEHEGTEIDCDAESVVLAIKRAATERAALLAVLRDLLSQLECVGIYEPGEDEGQWADVSGLSFSAAEAAIKKVQA